MAGFCPYTEFLNAIKAYRTNVQNAKEKWLLRINNIINAPYWPAFDPELKTYDCEEANALFESELENSRKEFATNIRNIFEKWSTTTVECP